MLVLPLYVVCVTADVVGVCVCGCGGGGDCECGVGVCGGCVVVVGVYVAVVVHHTMYDLQSTTHF